MKKRGDIEQIFIKNANFEFLPDFRPARGKNGENEGVRNGGKWSVKRFVNGNDNENRSETISHRQYFRTAMLIFHLKCFMK